MAISTTFPSSDFYETVATYKTISKSNFVRPEKESRNYCTEPRQFRLRPATPPICSKRTKLAFYGKVRARVLIPKGFTK